MQSWWGQAMGPSARRWRRKMAGNLMLSEAAVSLLMARLALALISFQHLTRLFARRPRTPELTGPERCWTRGNVQTALARALIRLPFKTTCFHQAIAAQAMLRRRGVGATLCYGATTSPDRQLRTHVWLQDGMEGIVGQWVAERDGYHILARYPEVPISQK